MTNIRVSHSHIRHTSNSPVPGTRGFVLKYTEAWFRYNYIMKTNILTYSGSMTWVYMRFNVKLNLHERKVDNYYNIILWYGNMFMRISTHLAHNVYIYYACRYIKPENMNSLIFCNRRRHRRFLFRKYYIFFCARGYIVPCATLIRYLLPTCKKNHPTLGSCICALCLYIFIAPTYLRLPTPYAQIQPL